jgi:protein SCO1
VTIDHNEQKKTRLMDWLWRGLIAVLVLALAGVVAFKVFQPIQVLPRIRLAPGFALRTQGGDRLTNADLGGKFVVYSFVSTRCGQACESINQTMRDLQNRLAAINTGGIPVRLVTISVDPEHDDAAALAAYAQAQGADPNYWTFGTTDDTKLLKTIVGGGFETYYHVGQDGSLEIAPKIVLVDGLGIIRSEYRYQTLKPDLERIVRHLGVLAKEVQNSQGPTRLAYEAAHLFLCYSP